MEKPTLSGREIAFFRSLAEACAKGEQVCYIMRADRARLSVLACAGMVSLSEPSEPSPLRMVVWFTPAGEAYAKANGYPIPPDSRIAVN